jgi:adiponectin receptor
MNLMCRPFTRLDMKLMKRLTFFLAFDWRNRRSGYQQLQLKVLLTMVTTRSQGREDERAAASFSVVRRNKKEENPEKQKRLDSYTSLADEGFAYLGDNSYIHHGYRLHYSVSECFHSLFELHNETINVWTHLIGSLIFFTLFFVVCTQQIDKHASVVDQNTHHIEVSNQPFMIEGHHTLRLFIAHTAHTSSERIFMQSLSLHGSAREFLQAASVFFSDTLKDMAIVDPSIYAEVEQLKHYIQQIQHQLFELTEHAWLNRRMAKNLVQLQRHVQVRLAPLEGVLPPTYAHMMHRGLHALTDSLANLQFELTHQVPTWPIGVFIVSAIICLTCSATFHLLFVVNHDLYFLLSRMDYGGIAILIAGSFYPLIYYAFYCHTNLIVLYLAAISLLASGTALIVLIPKFSTAEYLFIRTSIFISLGCFGVLPMAHLVYLYGFEDPTVSVILSDLLLMGCLYIFGAAIYATRFPERFMPGYFDVWFSSHQVWHVFVVIAALVHYSNVTTQYEWRWNNECPATS